MEDYTKRENYLRLKKKITFLSTQNYVIFNKTLDFQPHFLNIIQTLKGGCTRFEVEHISYNLLMYIGKT